MEVRILFYFFIGCFCCACGNKASETGDSLPEICLDPDHVGTLKVSDYFDRVSVCMLRGTLFFRVTDFVEYQGKYVLLAHDDPDMNKCKTRFYWFDQEGYFTHTIGEVGRGAGEYQTISNGLQIKDSVFHIIDHIKYLALSLDGEVVKEKKINFYEGTSKAGFLPVRIWNDSLIILYTSSDLGKRVAGMYRDAGKSVNPYLIDFYSLNTGQIVGSHFPMKEVRGVQLKNALYEYRDTLCFYHDKNQIIYRVFPDHVEERYRVNKGKYDRILTLEEYRESLRGELPRSTILMSACNETDRYVLGNYVFKNRVYYFIYDKRTRETKNFRRVNNDLLGVDGRNGKNSLIWRSGFYFKQDYLWLKVKMSWVDIIGQVKSRLNEEEWKRYCEKHPDFIRIYEELRKDKEALEKTNIVSFGDEEEKVVLLKYYFK